MHLSRNMPSLLLNTHLVLSYIQGHSLFATLAIPNIFKVNLSTTFFCKLVNVYFNDQCLFQRSRKLKGLEQLHIYLCYFSSENDFSFNSYYSSQYNLSSSSCDNFGSNKFIILEFNI